MGLVIVDKERCKGCRLCIDACRKELMSVDEHKRNRSGYPVAVFLGEDDCSGCALCAEVCPDVALEVYR